jgi:biopolymer transport protein ExbB
MEMSLKQLFDLGGWAMWPLLVFSMATFTLIIERTLFLVIHNLNVREIKGRILERLIEGDLPGAEKICGEASRRRLAAGIFSAALGTVGLGEHRMERAMEAAASKQVQSLEKGFDLLVALGSIAPITGFLGTVSGMISAFQSIANAADVNAQLVAGGIFEALITTAYGLAIAIVAITGYNVFAHIADRFAAAVEDAGNEIITVLLLTGNGGSPASGGDVEPSGNAEPAEAAEK